MDLYQVLILPNTTRFYLKQVFEIVEHYRNNAVVITLDPKYLLDECPECDTQFICRIDEDGSVLPDADLLKRVCEAKPHILILDDCFWEEDDCYLLNKLLNLQKNNPTFNIINVVQLSFPDSWKKLMMAQRIRFPASKFQTKMFHSNSYPLTLYDNDEELTPRSNAILLDSPTSPETYKQVFGFYQLLHNIRCLTEMDLFCMFLKRLNDNQPNKHLLQLFIETRKYSFYGELLPNKEFSPHFITEYITIINHIVIQLVQTNDPLFHEVCGFFTSSSGF